MGVLCVSVSVFLTEMDAMLWFGSGKRCPSQMQTAARAVAVVVLWHGYSWWKKLGNNHCGLMAIFNPQGAFSHQVLSQSKNVCSCIGNALLFNILVHHVSWLYSAWVCGVLLLLWDLYNHVCYISCLCHIVGFIGQFSGPFFFFFFKCTNRVVLQANASAHN